MTASTAHHIINFPALDAAAHYDPDDGTLSSGEAALARIVGVLLANLDALDGAQLTQLTAWLAENARVVIAAERAGLASLGINRDANDEPDFS